MDDSTGYAGMVVVLQSRDKHKERSVFMREQCACAVQMGIATARLVRHLSTVTCDLGTQEVPAAMLHSLGGVCVHMCTHMCAHKYTCLANIRHLT